VTPEETRERLVHAAARVFAERGYEGTRVGDIAEAAGLSRGALYAHFPGKADLLAEAIRARGREELEGLLAGDGPASVADLLVALGSSLQHRSGQQGLLLVEAIVAARRDKAVARALSGDTTTNEGVVAELVRGAQASGALDPTVPPAVLARFCLMLALGSLLVRTLGLPATDDTDWTEFIRRLVDGFRTEVTV